jgi:hypothetical protein
VERAARGRVDEGARGPPGLAAAGLGLPAAAGLYPASAPAAARQSGWRRAGGVERGALAAAVAAVRQAHPAEPIARWGSDQHRVGLKPIRRAVWARRGPRMVVAVQPREQWTARYGCVPPRSGQTWWLALPTVRADLFRLALAECAQAVDAGQGKPVLLLLERAGWHRSRAVQVPDGSPLVWLPPSLPELQPAERLWPLAAEALATQTFPPLDDLETVLAQRGVALQAQPARIHAETLFQWWPTTACLEEPTGVHPDVVSDIRRAGRSWRFCAMEREYGAVGPG